MQSLRNLTWWLIGLTSTITFGLVVWLSDLLSGQFWNVPQSAIITVYVALFLGFINKISALQLGDTLVHEIGHAQIAALTFGKVSSIHVQRDTSGVTFFAGGRFFRRISMALVSLFGPISSSVVFLITARFISSELSEFWVLGAAIFISLILITTVRNFWGWVTGLVFLVFLYILLETSGFIEPTLLGAANSSLINDYLVNFLLGVVSFNAGTALRYSVKGRFPKNPQSDEYRFSRSLFLPVTIGGHVILLMQMLLLWIGISYLLGWSSAFEIGRLI
jgi:hypothetical protein